jgi:DNA replication protein DnaC
MHIPSTSQTTVDLCKRLRLGTPFIDAVLSKKSKERDYLCELIAGEIDRRDGLRVEKYIKSANFPEFKMLDEFDFADVSLPSAVTRDYFTNCHFIRDRYSLFMYGPPGTGKTHLAIALGIEACKRFYKVALFRLTDLISHLRTLKHASAGKLRKQISKADLIIIDEFGYPPRDDDTTQIFFDFITDTCYEKKSLIMTSNRTVTEWLSDFTDPRDERMAHATIDRIVQHTLLFSFTGESHRARGSCMIDRRA